ncbi:hypothetical protein [Amycolatopsis sp. WQ 127309]|uniref:hypothetical protein n=1 Tax=Amycolatopsis sp. WQ 127309 TaxID=2932773 RepID=UPI001FF4B0B9|nr:hypothetical protein [Amycolatopsis sp. WQ 127309]UOZ02716.1 hypothetical protein MUY22_28035 [Amycolatopsis sp. WQ 127309]
MDSAARVAWRADRGEQTEAARLFWAGHPEAEAVLARWRRLGTFGELPTLFTDYRLLADNPRSTVTPGPRYRDRPEEEPVARVVGIHNLALRAGVTEEVFDRFIAENHHRIDDYPDWRFHVLKGSGWPRSRARRRSTRTTSPSRRTRRRPARPDGPRITSPQLQHFGGPHSPRTRRRRRDHLDAQASRTGPAPWEATRWV